MKSKNTGYITLALVLLKQCQSKIPSPIYSVQQLGPSLPKVHWLQWLTSWEIPPYTISVLVVDPNALRVSNEQVKVEGISNMSNPIRGLVKHALSLKE